MVARIAALLVLSAVAAAQDYGFAVPEFVCNAALESDGDLVVYYEIEFRCLPGAHPIDIVDIGFPSSSYDLSSVAADLDGHPLEDIRPSSYIAVGVEVALGDHEIAPGRSATFRLGGTNPGLVYRDSSDPSYASLEFSPTWFDGALLEGQSDYTVRFAFPPGADSSSVRHHAIPFTSAWIDGDGRVIYEWRTTRTASSSYTVGVSFPDSLVTCPIASVKPSQTTGATTGTGHGPGLGEMGGCICAAAWPAIIIGLVILGVVSGRKRRLQYIKPSLGVEGVGIKRGLTVPEVAVLLEEKLDRILRLILFGAVRKGALALDAHAGAPLFSSVDPGAADLHDYEKNLLAAIRPGKTGRDAMDRDLLKEMFVKLVRDVETRMKGFSVRETREYYRSIMAEAWRQVAAAGGEGAAEAVVAEQLPWLLLDGRFEERAGSIPALRDVMIFPTRMGGSFRPLVSGGQGMTVTQFCSDVAGRLESAASGLIGNVDGFTATVTAVTNPIPVSSSSGRSHSGGCACACACAGCACACAGGGR